MGELIVKIQLKNYEKGEFGDIEYRTLEETMQLIRDYPWDTQRQLAFVELTCPSVTVEHPSGSFLKLGPYFGGKYCFYLCSKNGGVTTRVIKDLEDAYVLLQDYFSGSGTLPGFERYTFVINPKKHFKTNPFEYTFSPLAVCRYMRESILLSSLMIIVLTRFFSDWSILISTPGLAIFIGFFAIFGGGSTFLLFNYLPYVRDSYLKISKGQDEFLFGINGKIVEFNKHTITRITQYMNPSHKNPWGESIVYTIEFNDGQRIKFNSLLIPESHFQRKFTGFEIEKEDIFFPTFESVD